ncbi:glycosyltransferase family 4 protein [Vibrio toranzoniae]|uniref:glycosyltransferase family 4 protein n=1 Tax=Vibrio toranzoniae TaxID=1194427 RepID=UPI0013786FF7|nr:glycosyltransferase family 4 protein [Vibrio toranzoniae]NAZ70748.1 glycosyltransferase [Vibrio toranzoniae]
MKTIGNIVDYIMKKILVVSNMYPSCQDVSFGTFVKNCVSCLNSSSKFEVSVVKKARTHSFYNTLIGYLKLYIVSFFYTAMSKYDIYYVHYTSHSSLGVILGSYFNSKSVIISHVHGSDILKEDSVSHSRFWVKKLISKMVLSKSKLIIVPSAYYKSILVSAYPVDEKIVRVSPSGGVDQEIFLPEPNLESRVVTKLVLGYVGRLTKDKGFDDFCTLVNNLGEDNTFEFVIVGAGPMSEKAKSLSSRDNVQYIDKVSQYKLPEIYNSLDVFVFPTKRVTESLGLVAIEAMACGVPVIAYNTSGPKEYIVEGQNGFLVDKGNVTLLEETVRRFSRITDENLMFMKKNALLTANRYSKVVVAEDMLNMFEETLNER